MSDFNMRLAQAGIDAGLIDLNRTGFQRLRTSDKPSKRNGAVIVLNSSPLRVWYQNHATGVSGVVTEGGSGYICREDWDKFRAARQAEQHERRRRQHEAATLAERAWDTSKPADPEHPYLRTKQVRPRGLRQLDDGYLLVPLWSGGLIWNLQTIASDGQKRFLAGGRKVGCYFTLGVNPKNTLLLVEGFATGASLFEALGLPVAVCFDCGNLLPVGEVLRNKYPSANFLYCADNDAKTEGNPGLTHATKAAAITRGIVVQPQFRSPCENTGLSDWNDYANQYGLEAVRRCFAEVVGHG